MYNYKQSKTSLNSSLGLGLWFFVFYDRSLFDFRKWMDGNMQNEIAVGNFPCLEIAYHMYDNIILNCKAMVFAHFCG